MLTNSSHGSSHSHNTDARAPHSRFKWHATLSLLLLIVSLVVIHAGTYTYIRNTSENGLHEGSTGWSSTTPVFEQDIGEFVVVGLLGAPILLLTVIFTGWYDFPAAVVTMVLSLVDVVAVLFVAVGVAVVYGLDRHNAFGGPSFCSNPSNNNLTSQYCKAQSILLAGIIFLFATMLLCLFLAWRALVECRMWATQKAAPLQTTAPVQTGPAPL